MSSNKTTNLQLNQWQAGDAFLREEFNQDNGKIDAKVHAIETAAVKVLSGSWVGNGRAGQEVSIGFRPKFVIICSAVMERNDVLMLSTGAFILFNYGGAMNGSSSADASVKLTDKGFLFTRTGYNTSDQTGYYIAFG